MRIYGIGEPGAEKILLFTGSHAVMGLDSNGLRVLTRLGYGTAAKSYTTTYRSATAAALPELGSKIDSLVEANLLLRTHGQTVCKTSAPRCGACVIREDCPSAR
jgi:endonuclease-3